MNNKKIIAIVLGLAVIVGVGVYYSSYGQGGLQGMLRAPQNALQVDLSPQSPSGSRSISVSDNVAVYNLCSSGMVKIKTISFSLLADGGGMVGGDLDQVTLHSVKIGGNEVAGNLAAGVPDVNQDFTSLYKGLYKLNRTLQIPAGECQEMAFYFDTAATLAEDAGADDPLTFTLSKIYNNDKKEITSNLPVSANTLKY